jgi:hypothetical protein
LLLGDVCSKLPASKALLTSYHKYRKHTGPLCDHAWQLSSSSSPTAILQISFLEEITGVSATHQFFFFWGCHVIDPCFILCNNVLQQLLSMIGMTC